MESQKEISDLLSKRFSEDQTGKVGKQIWKSEVIDIEFTSPHKKLKAIITSADNEVSLFFEDSNSKSDWHTHMSLFGANEIHEQIEKALDLIQGLISKNQAIVESSKYGYWLPDDEKDEFKYADNDEMVSLVKWEDI